MGRAVGEGGYMRIESAEGLVLHKVFVRGFAMKHFISCLTANYVQGWINWLCTNANLFEPATYPLVSLFHSKGYSSSSHSLMNV